MSIIIAEDLPIVRELLCKLLGMEKSLEIVSVVADAESALQLFAGALQADLLLTDLQMDGMNGIELAARLRRDFPSLLIVMLTFFPIEIAAPKALATGADACLSKDGDLDELLAVIRRLSPPGAVC